jgi:hypothetical protein
MTTGLSSSLSALRRAFAAAPDKHTAHRDAGRILQDMAASPAVFAEILARHLTTPGALSTPHYPVVSMAIEASPDFDVVANCWIPLPDADTDVSTKAIHHHGEMLLTTVNAFGHGYVHWQFTTPEPAAGANECSMRLTERALHGAGSVAFVDAYVPHVPFYPPSLTITYALWSTRRRSTWKDRVKRVPALRRRSAALRRLAVSLGLKDALELKVVRDFDYCPAGDVFITMQDREEFARGPVEDYLYSLFHVIQQTGNEAAAPAVRARLDAVGDRDRPLVARLLADLEAGRPIGGRLSPGHYGVPFANFRSADIERALAGRGRPAPALSTAHAHGR